MISTHIGPSQIPEKLRKGSEKGPVWMVVKAKAIHNIYGGITLTAEDDGIFYSFEEAQKAAAACEGQIITFTI